MSKYMQLTVIVRPYFAKDFESVYPKLARRLSLADPAFAAKGPSLYEIVGQLDMLLYRSEGMSLRNLLLARREKLKELYRNIETNIAEWNLSAADRFMYELEDMFDEIERELG